MLWHMNKYQMWNFLKQSQAMASLGIALVFQDAERTSPLSSTWNLEIAKIELRAFCKQMWSLLFAKTNIQVITFYFITVNLFKLSALQHTVSFQILSNLLNIKMIWRFLHKIIPVFQITLTLSLLPHNYRTLDDGFSVSLPCPGFTH